MHEQIPDFQMPSAEQARLAAESLRLLADPTRIKLLWALLQGESSVACLAGLVRGRRQGTFIYYTAADVHVRRLLAEALFHAGHAEAEHVERDLPDPGSGSPAVRRSATSPPDGGLHGSS